MSSSSTPLYGDTNLDGTVNSTDQYNVDNGYESLTGWSNGDFDYDGVVDGSDYTLLDAGQAGSPTLTINAPTDPVVAGTPATFELDATGYNAANREVDA